VGIDIIENRSGSPKSPVSYQIRQTAMQNRMDRLACYTINNYVGMYKEIVNPKSFLVPISSVAAGQRLIRKTIHTETVGRSDEKYGIISDGERFVSENGRTLKRIEATFIDNGNVKRMQVEYDITELVNAGAKPEEIPILEFTTDANGVLIYASRQYDDNIDAYKRKTGYDKGVYRDGVVGKYNIKSFMIGRQQQEMENIFQETRSGFHVIREINVPFFLSFGLHCKDSNMTNVVVSYIMQDGMLFYGAINNSKQSDREWKRVWIGITKRKFWRIRARKFRRERIDPREVGIGGAAMLQFAALGPAASMGFSGMETRESRLLARFAKGGAAFGNARPPKKGGSSGAGGNLGYARPLPMGYFSSKMGNAINAMLKSKAKAISANVSLIRLSTRALYASPTLVMGLSVIRHLDASAMKAAFLNPARAKAAHKAPARAMAKAALPSAAISAYYGIRKGVAAISSGTRKSIMGYVASMAAAFRKEAGRIGARLEKEANCLMIRILSYVTFGVRRHIEIRNISYYPYVERFGCLV
jgi:hypothetical protein